jgi:O-antigen biosynthesis protein
VTSVALPSVESPTVSIVIVTYGGKSLVERCLGALTEHTPPTYEVIVVDNASPDGTAEFLQSSVQGARLFLNEENQGFLLASNQGADAATGRYLCFLNSDAFVEPGWLPPLLAHFERDARAGAVVPLFLHPDGSVQEAGSVVDYLGWALAVGDGGDPDRLEFRFPREIDFGSAACLLTPRHLFGEVGGFEPAYAPGYFEDVDYCFALKARGFRTIFEPRSRVVHVRSATASSKGAQSLTERNRSFFFERWNERLAARPRLRELPTHPHRIVAARDAEALDRILVIDDRVPHFDRGSGDTRMSKLLGDLAALYSEGRITLAAADGNRAERYAPPLLAQGIEVICPPVDWRQWFELRPFHYSVVIISRVVNFERFGELIRRTQPQASVVFDIEALSHRFFETMADVVTDPARAGAARSEAVRTRALEFRAIQEADAIFCVSEEELAIATELMPEKLSFLLPGSAVILEWAPPYAERTDLIYYGGFLAGPGSPNEDALLHLVENVLPHIRKAHPGVVLRVVGADPTPAVKTLHGDGIEVVGYVETPYDWLSRACVHLHPIRFGAGIKNKLLDTIGAGLPFVTTSSGAEGFPLGDLRPLLVADEPEEIAARASALLADEELWTRAQHGLLELARERFSRRANQRTLVEAMSHFGVAPTPGAIADLLNGSRAA